jgi:hypothetical protein
MKEILEKISTMKERPTGEEIEGVALMTGSILTFTINTGWFNSDYFPMD